MSTERPAARRPTSKDVAAAAGVSRSTVSQVFNGAPGFPEATRAKVLATAEQLGYRPSRLGRALVTGASDLVLIVVPNATYGPNLQDLVDGVTERASAEGKSVVVRFGEPHDEAFLTTIMDLHPADVFDLGALSEAQRERASEMGARVLPSRAFTGLDGAFAAMNARLAALQLDALADGERRLVFARELGKRRDHYGPGRATAVAHEAANRGLATPIEIRVPLEAAAATAALDAALDAALGAPLGICCYNDDVAIALCAAVRVRGLRIPDDVALVGIDATQLGQLVSPRLTTIAITGTALTDPGWEAALAADLVVELIPGETTAAVP